MHQHLIVLGFSSRGHIQSADSRSVVVTFCSLTIAHSDRLPPWPLSLLGSSVNLAPANKSKPTSISLYMTFDIGLGEQHKLNCLRQRGTWKASWDGLGKYTEFYPAIGTIGSNTSKCDLCCQMKDILCLVGHFRVIVCSLHHASPQNSPKTLARYTICTVFSHYQLHHSRRHV